MRKNVDQMNSIDMYRAFYPTAIAKILFASAYRSFFKADHMLGHKINLNKLEKTEIIPIIFSEKTA